MLWVVEDVLEAEKVNWLVGVLSHVQPVLEPCLVCRGAALLELEPVGEDRFFCELVRKLSAVHLTESQIEERRVCIKLVACTHHSNFAFPILLEGQNKREMRLFDPSSTIGQAFSFEPAKL